MIKNKTWEKNWSGQWSILTCGYLGQEYITFLKPYLGKNLKRAIMVSHQGHSTCYYDKADKDSLGKYLLKQNHLKWCKDIIKASDEIIDFIKKNKRRKIDQEKFNQFLELMHVYGGPHRGMKFVTDYLSPQKLKKLLPKLEEARVYAEPVYTEIEKFMVVMGKQISPDALNMTPEELDNYWQTGQLPPKKILQARYKNGAVVVEKGQIKIFSGKKALAIEKQLQPKKNKNLIQGQTAYPGKVKGRVKIILNPRKVKNFNQGDILVTGMTRPEYLSLMKKSAGFITNEGGITCHAAILARELKKPCVIGTQVATKVLRDGMLVEVKANHGIVKIIKQSYTS